MTEQLVALASEAAHLFPLQDDYYLHERYRAANHHRWLHSMYYALRPMIPRSVQIALRRKYSKVQAQATFPAWPIESILVERQKTEIVRFMRTHQIDRLPFVNFWPRQYRAAVVLTHDVESAKGVQNIRWVREVERQHGLVSSWNFVPERYPFESSILGQLTEEGCEIGVHGLYHDGKLFASKKIFESRVPKINAYIRDWQAVGFRSPATHRNPDWMPMIEAEYDSSFPDTDPFEPQAGGCCSIFPFFLRNLVELPITMPQDHTLFEILGEKDIRLWRQKADWLIQEHGLVMIIVHPDYMISEERLDLYDQLLGFLKSMPNLWYALPKDVARWWRARSATRIKRSREGSLTTSGLTMHIAPPACAVVHETGLEYGVFSEV